MLSCVVTDRTFSVNESSFLILVVMPPKPAMSLDDGGFYQGKTRLESITVFNLLLSESLWHLVQFPQLNQA